MRSIKTYEPELIYVVSKINAVVGYTDEISITKNNLYKLISISDKISHVCDFIYTVQIGTEFNAKRFRYPYKNEFV